METKINQLMEEAIKEARKNRLDLFAIVKTNEDKLFSFVNTSPLTLANMISSSFYDNNPGRIDSFTTFATAVIHYAIKQGKVKDLLYIALYLMEIIEGIGEDGESHDNTMNIPFSNN